MSGIVIVIVATTVRGLASIRTTFEGHQHRFGAFSAFYLVERQLTREHLASLASLTIDTLVLVDHYPFAGAAPSDQRSEMEAIREEGCRAVFAWELGSRTTNILYASSGDAQPTSVSLGARSAGPILLNDAANHTLLKTYLQPLFSAFERIEPCTLVWPREAFLDGDAPGQALPAAIELAGRARILAYGPYLPLPTGIWQATAYLGFSPDIGKMPFIFEVDGGGIVERGFFEVERPGFFSISLEFRVLEALYPVELRLISQDSALEGQVAFIEVELKQLRSN